MSENNQSELVTITHTKKDLLSHLEKEPASIRYLQPNDSDDFNVIQSIANWGTAQKFVDFPTKGKGMHYWLNESNRPGHYYTERSFAVCLPNGEMYGFINSYPTSTEFSELIEQQLGIPQVNRQTESDLYLTYSRRPDMLKPRLIPSGLRQTCLKIKEMVDHIHQQDLSIDGKHSRLQECRMVMTIDPNNNASIKVAEEAGFENKGTVVDSVNYDEPKTVSVFVLNWEKLSEKLIK